MGSSPEGDELQDKLDGTVRIQMRHQPCVSEDRKAQPDRGFRWTNAP